MGASCYSRRLLYSSKKCPILPCGFLGGIKQEFVRAGEGEVYMSGSNEYGQLGLPRHRAEGHRCVALLSNRIVVSNQVRKTGKTSWL